MKQTKIKNKNGFTLFELLITLVVTTITTTIFFSSFSKYSKAQNARAAAYQVAFILKEARSYARTNGYNTQLTFTAGNSNYSISANATILTKSSSFDTTSGILPNNTQIISNNCNNDYFYIDGTMLTSANVPETNTCSIVVGYNNGSQQTITIDPQTGNIIYG